VLYSDSNLLDHLLDYILILSPSGQVQYCNEAFANLIKKTPKRIIGKSVFDFFESIPEISNLLINSNSANLIDQYTEVNLSLVNSQKLTVNLHRKKIFIDDTHFHYLITLRDSTVESQLHSRYRAQLTEKEELIRRLDLKIFELEFILELLSISWKNTDSENAGNILFETILNKIPAEQITILNINPNVRPYQIKVTGHFQGHSSILKEIELNLMNLISSKIEEMNLESQNESVVLDSFEVNKEFNFLGIMHLGRDLSWYFFGIKFLKSRQDYFRQNLNFLKAITQQTLVILENQMLYLNSITDDRTKLFNHRYFDYRFEYEVKRALRYKNPLSFLIIDIDQFKKINDELGHQEGDNIIKKVANILREHFRTSDILARYGGDEFVAILPQTPLSGAIVTAKRLIEKIRATKHQAENGTLVNITLSIGISSIPEHGDSVKSLLEKADKALYDTKTRGRNNFSCYPV
jgi:diguanylate cyclase (GGDEF)-like protein